MAPKSTKTKQDSNGDINISTDLIKIKNRTIDVLPEKELIKKLKKAKAQKKPLIIKSGFDPTAPDLHLGHLVLLRKLKDFQDLGHEVHFLVGDFTAMIGDPSGKSETRKQLSHQEVKANAKTYCKQVFRILDEKKTKIRFNSDWCQDMKFAQVLNLTARYTIARLLERDDFLKRYQSGASISLIEFMYPLIQGYDSVAMQADIEIGGSDQKFNLLVGRELQSSYGHEPQVIITLPLLVGLDGKRKMSKSYNNYIGIDETPYQILAKCMSISDELMWDYFHLLTDFSEQEISEMQAETNHAKNPTNPMQIKKYLAVAIVDSLHQSGAGREARLSWEKEKGQGGRNQMILPPNVLQYIVPKDQESMLVVDILVASGLEKSKSSVRRLVQSHSIKLGDDLQLISDPDYRLQFPGEYKLKIGKKRYLIAKTV